MLRVLAVRRGPLAAALALPLAAGLLVRSPANGGQSAATAPFAARMRTSLNAGWKFLRERRGAAWCSQDSFPEDLQDYECDGLQPQAQVADKDGCMQTCCNLQGCDVWRWCPQGQQGCMKDVSCVTGSRLACRALPAREGKHHRHLVARGRKESGIVASVAGQDCKDPRCSTSFEEDGKWRTVDLPHDFIVEGNYSVAASKWHGYLPFGSAWYRTRFSLPLEARNSSVWLDFEGVQALSAVYLNGQLLGTNLNGYTPARYYVGQQAEFGHNVSNILAVHVDANKPDGWWYDGGGIYRNVWLNVANAVHVEPWGVYLPTKVTFNGTSTSAQGYALTTVANRGGRRAIFFVRTEIRSPLGKIVLALDSKPVVLLPNLTADINQSFAIDNPQLWSLDKPALYSCETRVICGVHVLDQVTNTFGIRSAKFYTARGFELNGNREKIKGMANHQDAVGVGVAVPDRMQAWRVYTMKEMGANAWRTAHNPPNEALLDECDRQGLLVWDENHRLQGSDQGLEDLRRMILRDRNHPSVIMWSLCNEALCMDLDPNVSSAMKRLIQQLDPDGGRPVTAALNTPNLIQARRRGKGKSTVDLIDVVGINYQPEVFETAGAFGQRPLISSEASSMVSDRSVYENEVMGTMLLSAQDANWPQWGSSARNAWCAVEAKDSVGGEFVWTGFDYRGEPTPLTWPNVNSHFGAVDMGGFYKDSFYYYQSVWHSVESRPLVHLLPHWNWNIEHGAPCHGTGLCKSDEGNKTVEIQAYTNGDEVEAFLNGKSLGRKKVDHCQLTSWRAPFEQGLLTARAYRSGRAEPIATDSVETTGLPRAVLLTVEWPRSGWLEANGLDVALVRVSLVDAKGALVPTAGRQLHFSLEGPGQILGLGNGNPSSHERDRPSSRTVAMRSAWNGLAMVVLQASTMSGNLTLQAVGEDLDPGLLSIPVLIRH